MNKFFIIVPYGDGYTYSAEQYVPIFAKSREDAVLAFDQMLDDYVSALNTWRAQEAKLSDLLGKLDQDAKDFYAKYIEIHNQRSVLVRPEFKVSGVAIGDDDFVDFVIRKGSVKKDDYYLNIVSVEELFEKAQKLEIK